MKNFNNDDFELRESQKLEGHTGKVLGITWKEDTGKWGFPAVIASSSDDKTIRIWKENFAGFFEFKAVLEVSSTVRSCAWSRPCELFAAACSDVTTAIFKNVGVHAYERIYTLKGHENEVRSVSWHVNWQLLATCGGDKSIWIWEVLPGNEFDCTSVLQGHTEDVNIVQWHGNGNANAVVSGSSDNIIKQTYIYCAVSLSLCKFGERMVSCSDDLTIKIWNSEWRENTDFWSYGCTLSGYHNTAIFSVDWLRQDQGPEIIASSGAGDAIRVFIEDKDNEILESLLYLLYRLVLQVDGLAFKLLLKKEKAHEMNVNSVKWLSWDKRLLASARNDGTVKIWELLET